MVDIVYGVSSCIRQSNTIKFGIVQPQQYQIDDMNILLYLFISVLNL